MGLPSKSCELDVRVTPRASKNKAAAVNGAIKVWVTAPPVDGQANQAVCETIAKALGVAKSMVEITSGHTGRSKRLRIQGLDRTEALSRLGGATLL